MASPSSVLAVDPRKVAVYVRWSTDEQSEGHTLEVQTERCRLYVMSQGWVYHDDLVFVDDGYSGGNMHRPALGALRERARAGDVACVVVYKLDRLSRNVVDVVDLVLKEWDGRCAVRSCTEDINTLTPAGRMFFNVLVSFAEYERGIIKERTWGGKLKNAEKGRNPGMAPAYGYARGAAAGDVEVHPGEAPVVQRIFRAYLGGAGIRQIADGLNKESVPAPQGSRWYAQIVRYILANEAYLGTLRYGGVVTAGAWAPLVAEEEFRQARALLETRRARSRAGRKPTYNNQYLLTGHAVCRGCGGTLVPFLSRSRRYYRCSRSVVNGRSACDCGGIPMGDLDEIVARHLKAHLGSEGRAGVREHMEARLAAQRGEVQARLGNLQRQLADVERRKGKYRADYGAGELGARAYMSLLDEAIQDEERLRLEQQGRQDELRRLDDAASGLSEVERRLDELDLWDNLPMERRRLLVQTLTERVAAFRPVIKGWTIGKRSALPRPPLEVEIDLIDLGV